MFLGLAAAAVLAGALGIEALWGAHATRAKNVILMIADGSGANTVAATGMYTGKLNHQIFDGPEWTKVWVSTYPLRIQDKPLPGREGLAQDPEAVYAPAKAWDTTPVEAVAGRPADRFAGYRWNKKEEPDSADTMSAIMTGHKTYDGAINVDGNGNKLDTLAEQAKRAGQSVGVVTTVQVGDATPAAGGGAHNLSRANRVAITNELLNSGVLSVLMGAGNPEYDDNGRKVAAPSYEWIDGRDWAALKTGTHPGHFTLIQNKADFDALATMATPPEKVVGIARAYNATQYERAGGNPAAETPFSVPRRTDVPSLSTMVLGALNILGRNSNGLFLVVEGGATDRAMHDNNVGRMIEEKIEFDEAIGAVSAYLEANTNGNNWGNTLVVVTADHDHLLMGPDSDVVPFQDLKDNGPGKLPGYRWQHSSHSNQLVPLYARGVAARMFQLCAKKQDAYTDAMGRKFGRGAYLDETDILGIVTANGHCT